MSSYFQKLEQLSRPHDGGFSEIFDDYGIASSVESVLIPLYSCVQVIQRENPNLITIPELIIPASHGSVLREAAGSVIGSVARATITGVINHYTAPRGIIKHTADAISREQDDIIGSSLKRSLLEKRVEVYYEKKRKNVSEDHGVFLDDFNSIVSNDDSWDFVVDDKDFAKQEAEKALDEQAFDLYCKCRQFIEVAKGRLKPEEEAVLKQVISRTEGASYRKRYDELFHPKREKKEDDKVIKPLVLPDDFFHNPSYFDPSASVIGVLSDKVLKGGGQRFAILIECLASRSFGYIQPTFGNKRLLASRLSGCKLESSYSEVEWIEKRGRSVSETEKVMLWLTNYLYGGGYDRAYEVLNFERHVKPGQETANLKNADKILRDRISLLYLNV